MLTFYRNNKNRFSKWVESKLEEMVVAHKLIDVDPSTTLPDDIPVDKLPVLSDGHEQWTSPQQIREFLEKLHQDLRLSQSMQSDTCYLDPDEPDDCL
ncbi:MAG: hypothetical protein U5J63_12255 [Fodinibius sp.]|nr:hypothetical protein [Fodinibius sp.]